MTHRAGKPWKSGEAAVDEHGGLPIYYRQDGLVTHIGIIRKIVIDPTEDTPGIEEFLNYITEDDTYEYYHEQLDTTTYVVRDGTELDESFPQSELTKAFSDEAVSEDFTYQPAVRGLPGLPIGTDR